MMDFAAVIKKVLPHLQGNLLQQLIEKLIGIGVENEDDLQLVTEADLTSVMKPILVRKLLNCWSHSDTHANTGLSLFT